jgi:hypothetical protein
MSSSRCVPKQIPILVVGLMVVAFAGFRVTAACRRGAQL